MHRAGASLLRAAAKTVAQPRPHARLRSEFLARAGTVPNTHATRRYASDVPKMPGQGDVPKQPSPDNRVNDPAGKTDIDAAATEAGAKQNTVAPKADDAPKQDPELAALLRAIDEGPQQDDDAPPRPSRNNPKEGYKSSADRKRERTFNVFAGLSLVGAIGGVIYLGREDEDSAIKGYSPSAWWTRVKSRFGGQMDYYTEPAFEKLLPDPLPEPYQRRYTLILDLDDLLIHSEWTRERGWRTAKRPGLDYFLSYLSQYYEIVVFTNQYAGTALPIIQKLDPYRSSLSASLFRESAKYEDGKFIKDLSYMNRPIEKLIVIDTNPDAVSKQPENAIVLKPWTGETGPGSPGRDLLNLLPFLEYVAAVEVPDVRAVLKSYEGKDIATEYLRREQELRDRIAAGRSQSKSAGFFGGAKRGTDRPVEIFMDQQRARAQKAHAEYMQYLKDNGEKMLAEEKAREEEMLKGMTTSLVGWMSGGQGPQPGAAGAAPEQPKQA